MERLPYLKPAELKPELKPLYDDMKQGIEAHFKGFRAIDEDGALIGPWNPMLHYPQFGKPVWEYIKAMANDPTLPGNVREVIILAVGQKFLALYEIYAHTRVAELKGLSETKIATILAGHKPRDLTDEEEAAYDFVTALTTGSPLADANYKLACKYFGPEGTAEMIYLIGLYASVSMILNGFNVAQPEPA